MKYTREKIEEVMTSKGYKYFTIKHMMLISQELEIQKQKAE